MKTIIRDSSNTKPRGEALELASDNRSFTASLSLRVSSWRCSINHTGMLHVRWCRQNAALPLRSACRAWHYTLSTFWAAPSPLHTHLAYLDVLLEA